VTVHQNIPAIRASPGHSPGLYIFKKFPLISKDKNMLAKQRRSFSQITQMNAE
jgi:hypothetical protein